MDKQYFISVAPKYYALAAAIYFVNNASGQSYAIIREYTYQDEYENTFARIIHAPLLAAGVKFLQERQMLDVVEDDFGPDIFIRSESFEEEWSKLTEAGIEPFKKYGRLGVDGRNWLYSALDNLNSKFVEFGVSEEDFLEPDRDWEPLPLDREDPRLSEAVEKLELAVRRIEEDNGYAANVPEERSYVLGALKQTVDKLKNDTQVSIAFIRKNAIEPLSVVVKRFGKAAIGVAATGAGMAILRLLENAETVTIVNLLKQYFHF